jgi:hypothetical protein
MTEASSRRAKRKITDKRKLATVLASVGVLLLLALEPEPARSLPQGTHRIMLGVIDPNPAAFDRLTRHHHSLHLVFTNANSTLLENDKAAGRTTVITLSPKGRSSAAIARGAADSELIEQSQVVNDFGDTVWVRPMPEMNGHWSPWCAVTASGQSRGAAYSGTEFARAFRRIAIIMRGGSVESIDAKLRRAGLPPVKASLLAGDEGISASGQVKLLWNPQSAGSPDVEGNRPRDYWPGAAYIDYVGDDLYEIKGQASWPEMDAFYSEYSKPFVVAEWAPWGYDSPEFAEQMFAWVQGHSRTIALVYFDRGWSGGRSTFLLKSKPRTLAVYRREARLAVFKTG